MKGFFFTIAGLFQNSAREVLKPSLLKWALPFLLLSCSDAGIYSTLENVDRVVDEGLPNLFRVSSVARFDGYLYIAGPTVWRSPLDRSEWKEVYNPVSPIVAVATDSAGGKVFCASRDGVFESSDGIEWKESGSDGDTEWDYLRNQSGYGFSDEADDIIAVSADADEIPDAVKELITEDHTCIIDLTAEIGFYLAGHKTRGYDVIDGGELKTDKGSDGFSDTASFVSSREYPAIDELSVTGFFYDSANSVLYAWTEGNNGLFRAGQNGSLWSWERP